MGENRATTLTDSDMKRKDDATVVESFREQYKYSGLSASLMLIIYKRVLEQQLNAVRFFKSFARRYKLHKNSWTEWIISISPVGPER